MGNRKIIIYGVSFNGIEDLADHAWNEKPKDGVYVLTDSSHYPCFDSEDYAYEKRRYWNFVFGKTKEEARQMLQLVKDTPPQNNYYKLREDIPMIYWEGDSYTEEVINERCKDIIKIKE